MNNKLTITLAIILCIGTYSWQENKISVLIRSNEKVNSENKELQKNIKILESKLNNIKEQLKNAEEQGLKKTKEQELMIKKEKTHQKNSFHFDKNSGTYYGKLQVNGYLTIWEKPEPYCTKNCPIYNYALFNVLDTDNEFIDDFITEKKGNAFVGDNSFGLGCIEDGIIWRMSDSDEFGREKYAISPEESKAILNSNQNNPVTIELIQYPVSYETGGNVSNCHSYFTEIKIVK